MFSIIESRQTYGGQYIEGVCLTTDEKPVEGIANGSRIKEVNAATGELKNFQFDADTAEWVEITSEPGSGGSGSGGSGVDVIDLTLYETYEEEGSAAVLKDYLVMPEGMTVKDLESVDSKAVIRILYKGSCLYVNTLQLDSGIS